MSKQQENRFQAIIAHAKEYGFVFPSSEIYDGLSAVYDYGPWGSELKKNIRDYWWKSMTQMHENIVGVDATAYRAGIGEFGRVGGFQGPIEIHNDSIPSFGRPLGNGAGTCRSDAGTGRSDVGTLGREAGKRSRVGNVEDANFGQLGIGRQLAVGNCQEIKGCQGIRMFQKNAAGGVGLLVVDEVHYFLAVDADDELVI